MVPALEAEREGGIGSVVLHHSVDSSTSKECRRRPGSTAHKVHILYSGIPTSTTGGKTTQISIFVLDDSIFVSLRAQSKACGTVFHSGTAEGPSAARCALAAGAGLLQMQAARAVNLEGLTPRLGLSKSKKTFS